MKLLLISLLISFSFLTATHIRADSCSSITDSAECGYTPYCSWTNNACVYDPNAQPIPGGSKASDSLIIADPLKGKFNSPSSIINDLLPYLLSGAGIILFAMLIMGGFDIMTAATDAKKAEAGKGRITAAIIGFVIIFAAYWIAQILEILFGVNILK